MSKGPSVQEKEAAKSVAAQRQTQSRVSACSVEQHSTAEQSTPDWNQRDPSNQLSATEVEDTGF